MAGCAARRREAGDKALVFKARGAEPAWLRNRGDIA